MSNEWTNLTPMDSPSSVGSRLTSPCGVCRDYANEPVITWVHEPVSYVIVFDGEEIARVVMEKPEVDQPMQTQRELENAGQWPASQDCHASDNAALSDNHEQRLALGEIDYLKITREVAA